MKHIGKNIRELIHEYDNITHNYPCTIDNKYLMIFTKYILNSYKFRSYGQNVYQEIRIGIIEILKFNHSF